jgi:hypothetical protein
LTLKEKLKSIAIKSNHEAEASKADAPKIKAPVKTKMSKNRSDDFLESLIMSGVETKEKEKSIDDVQKELSRPPKGIIPVVSEMSTNSSAATKVPKRDLRAPLPMPSPETQAKMPMQRLLNQPAKSSMPPPPPVRVPLPPRPINPMQKTGVASALERQSKTDVFDYRHTSVLPKNVNKSTFEPSVFLEDEAYRRILKWRPAWFEVSL